MRKGRVNLVLGTTIGRTEIHLPLVDGGIAKDKRSADDGEGCGARHDVAVLSVRAGDIVGFRYE